MYIADINNYFIKLLLAGSIMMLCILEYSLLDKLYKNTAESESKNKVF